MLFPVSAAHPARIIFNIVHSKAALADYRPLRDSNGNIRKCLQQWPPQTSHGEPCYEVRAIVEISGTQDHLDLHVMLLQPRADFRYDQTRMDKSGKYHTELLPDSKRACIPRMKITQELWDGDRPHQVIDRTPALFLHELLLDFLFDIATTDCLELLVSF
ncbi:hypothetical protein EJ03DRAFT_166856 [Teratosphaeria nubilosa]|uniref:Uncharacterized protein n=1 Tax=Teratosphaeria nubilosa TaxID=161662 RepID=A0A6G1L3L3_9PEZI|nr:hypothetical protein EJ03DRAFT_166856 [Teratosphaeria nubilosa]